MPSSLQGWASGISDPKLVLDPKSYHRGPKSTYSLATKGDRNTELRVFLLFIAEAYQASYSLLVTGGNHRWQGQAHLAHIWTPLLVQNNGG